MTDRTGTPGVPEEPGAGTREIDQEADVAFQRLVRLAISLVEVPSATVWLIADGRLYRRVAEGSQAEDDREARAAVLSDNEPRWVDDLAAGPCSRDAAASDVRAWAGCPIRDAAGSTIGVLCAADVQPRVWSDHDRDVLTALAQAATGVVARHSALPGPRADRADPDRPVVAPEPAARGAERRARDAGVRAQGAGVAMRHYREQARSATRQAETSDQVAAEAQRLARLAEQHAAEADELAATLRESLLPARLPAFPGVEVAARYRPGTGASVLGDFYDLFPTPGGWGAVVGDVCGKGPRAARTTALARSTVRALGHTDDDPAAVFEALHGVLHVWFDQRPSFVTAVYAAMAPSAHGGGLDLQIASAGHPPGVVQRRDGSIVVLEAGGRALGVRADPRVAVESVDLGIGDRLLLFTDGVTEARPVGGREFELEGLLDVLGGLDPADDVHATADAVLEAVGAHAAGAALDDTALLVIRAGPRGHRPTG